MVTAAATPAGAAATDFPLTTSTFTRMVVAGGHVFIASAASSEVLVRNADGSANTSISEPTPLDLAASPDGTRVYVATGSSVVAIDTTSLTVVATYSTAACTTSVTAEATVVWFLTGCGVGTIGSINLATQPATVLLNAGASSLINVQSLVSSPAQPGRIVGWIGGSPSFVTLFDVSGTTMTAAQTMQIDNGELDDAAITSDGADLILAATGLSYHPAYKTSDLTRDGGYATTEAPDAVATTAADVVATGVYQGHPAVTIWSSQATVLQTHDYAASDSLTVSDNLAPRGLAFSSDGNTLYTVTTALYGANPVLHVITDASAAASSMTLAGPTGTHARATALALTGTLTSGGAPVASATLSVTKNDLDGAHTLPSVVTSPTGGFSIADTPQVGGTNTYTVSYAGTTAHTPVSKSVNVTVSRTATVMSIKASATIVNYKQVAVVTAHLGPTYKSRNVSLWVQPVGSPAKLLRTAWTDGNGNLSASAVEPINFTFIATFAGDERSAPASVSMRVQVRAEVVSKLSGAYAVSGGYNLFHTANAGYIDVWVAPDKAGGYVEVVLQDASSGTWRTVALLQAGLDSASHAPLAFHCGTGHPCRILAAFKGDSYNAAASGPTYYVKFV